MNIRQLRTYDRKAIEKVNQTSFQFIGKSPCPQDRSPADLLLVNGVANSIHAFIATAIKAPHIDVTRLDKRLLDNLFEVLDFQLRPPMS